jgi:uncharacterized DUF497 family protein
LRIIFEWDPAKARRNLSKHGVGFDEAAAVFADPLARIFADSDHSSREHREIIIGHTGLGRLLVVSFFARGESIRIISARRATRRERRDYEENVIP